MPYHPVVNKIKELLQSKQIEFETFEHEPVKTSEEAAKIRTGYTLEQGAKALIVSAKKSPSEKFFAMIVMPANLRLNSSKAKEILEAKEIRFASPEEINDITKGVQIGGVPPFGNLFQIPVIVDPKLFQNSRIVFNAGDRGYSIAIRSDDYQKAVEFKKADITE